MNPGAWQLARVALAMSIALLTAAPAMAFDYYHASKDGGCANCHGTFDHPLPELGGISLHALHRDPAYMGTRCTLCHFEADYYRVQIGRSQGTPNSRGIGCGGCHNRAGMIAKHGGSTSICTTSGCHGRFTVGRESTPRPSYYGTVDTNAANPCAVTGPGSEDWDGNGRALDNDGNGVFDMADADCAGSCGDQVINQGETCDPPAYPCITSFASCPPKAKPYNIAYLAGRADLCNVRCVDFTPTCASGDGACPMGCTAALDSDCVNLCGNSVIDYGEICDPPSSCPAAETDCASADACAIPHLTGSAAACTASCVYERITACAFEADGCCPVGCDTTNDSDCSPVCGNGVLETGETCDRAAADANAVCPTDCDDHNSCSVDSMVGSPSTCDVVCERDWIALCKDGDGCCPGACNATNDNDCQAVCGNGVKEPGETCDRNATVPADLCPQAVADCNDDNPCTRDKLEGSYQSCTAACAHDNVACDSGAPPPGATVAESRGFVCAGAPVGEAAAVGAVVALLLFWRRRRVSRAT